jgi:hypothetical protein
MMTGVRCSTSVLEAGLDPVGTANNVLGYLLVEWPLPWEAKPERIPELRAVADRAADLGLRLQLVHEVDHTIQPTRVGLVDRPDGPFIAYRRRVWTVPTGAVAATATIDDCKDAIAALALRVLAGGEPADPDPPLPDVLLCTHGSRDVCCGGHGMRLASEIVDRRTDLVVWRTSHLGGHRFAPTAVTLPDGHLWAFLDGDLLDGVVDRTVDPATAAAHYRGCSAAVPAAQLAERAAFVAEGWSLFDTERSTGAQPVGGSDAHDAWCEVRRPDGTGARYAGRVVVNRRILIPPCGATEPTDPTSDLRIDDLTVTPLAPA